MRHSALGENWSDAQETQFGALALLESVLDREGPLSVPPAAYRKQLDLLVSSLPPQFAFIHASSPIGTWLLIAAAAESLGVTTLAWKMLGRILDKAAAELSPDGLRELTAFCWARRGRMARVAGDFSHAETCYREAISRVRGLSWRDGRPHAVLGLTAIAVGRGNFPSARRYAASVLAVRPPVALVYQVQAHQLLALVAQRKQAWLDGMLHLWQAYDLIDAPSDIRRKELVVTMSAVALKLGDVDAAVRGYTNVLAAGVPLRVSIPAMAGLLDCIAQAYNHTNRLRCTINAVIASNWRPTPLPEYDTSSESEAVCSWLIDVTVATLASSQIPADQVFLLLALTRLAMARRELDRADGWVRATITLATTHQLHEKRFHAESLSAEIDSLRHALTSESLDSRKMNWESMVVKNRPPVLSRLATLVGRGE